jgi:hypothetical protein
MAAPHVRGDGHPGGSDELESDSGEGAGDEPQADVYKLRKIRHARLVHIRPADDPDDATSHPSWPPRANVDLFIS